MLERYFIRPETVDRIRASWIGAPIERYVGWLAERGYKARNVFHRVPVLMQFGEFAKSQGASNVEDLPGHVDAFVRRWTEQHSQQSKSETARRKVGHDARNPVEQLLQLELPGYAGSRRPRAPVPFQARVPGFIPYLRQERGLRETSVCQYEHHLRAFESYLKSIGLLDLGALSAVILSAFVADRSARLGRQSVRELCGVLRVFLRYLHREGVVTRDLSSAVEGPQVYRLSDIPRSISWESVTRLLESVDRRSPSGKRDYAILLLLVTYGLRAREVAALTLDDIDWRAERLRIPERKAGHSSAFPLSSSVGEALVDYLQHGRPTSPLRQVFLRIPAPPGPITHVVVSLRASHFLRKAKIEVARPGSHTLRHTCVQRLVDNGFSLKAIGDYVGHRAASSTEIYTKVDVETLRRVALGDGEEVL